MVFQEATAFLKEIILLLLHQMTLGIWCQEANTLKLKNS